MVESNNERSCGKLDELTLTPPCCRSLTVVGVALVVWGIGTYLAKFLYFLAKVLSGPLEPIGPIGLLIGVLLVALVPATVMRRIHKITLWTIIGIGLICYSIWHLGLFIWTFESGFLGPICRTFRYGLDERTAIGLAIAAIGLALIESNGYGPWMLQRLRKTSSVFALWSRTHTRLAVITSLFGLWLINPYHSHDSCIRASGIAESIGAYRTAIIFIKLARDTFPTTTFCGNCSTETQASLTSRIEYLERKNAGQDVQSKSPRSEDHQHDEAKQAPAWTVAGPPGG
jgi:hypothetical protein